MAPMLLGVMDLIFNFFNAIDISAGLFEIFYWCLNGLNRDDKRSSIPLAIRLYNKNTPTPQ
jgi:hypothetical protein